MSGMQDSLTYEKELYLYSSIVPLHEVCDNAIVFGLCQIREERHAHWESQPRATPRTSRRRAFMRRRPKVGVAELIEGDVQCAQGVRCLEGLPE